LIQIAAIARFAAPRAGLSPGARCRLVWLWLRLDGQMTRKKACASGAATPTIVAAAFTRR
jgi:hypothetical protein